MHSQIFYQKCIRALFRWNYPACNAILTAALVCRHFVTSVHWFIAKAFSWRSLKRDYSERAPFITWTSAQSEVTLGDWNALVRNIFVIQCVMDCKLEHRPLVSWLIYSDGSRAEFQFLYVLYYVYNYMPFCILLCSWNKSPSCCTKKPASVG